MAFDRVLEEHQVCSRRGFLPEQDPLGSLAEYYKPWDELATELPKLLMSGSVRSWLSRLPMLETERLDDQKSLERAMLVLSYFGSAWVWGEAEVSDRIPENIAIPWCQVANRIGRPPILSYSSHALNNWRRLDADRGIELGNLARLLNFYGGLDEEWFVLIHIVIEAKAAPAIAAAVRLRDAIRDEDEEIATASLREIAATLETIRTVLRRMPEGCDPYIYYRRVRPFIFGWAGNPALPNGVIYEGVAAFDGRGQKFRGETGAQSAIIPTIDVALGVEFDGNTDFAEHLNDLRNYMPPKHRQLIHMLERQERDTCCRDWIRRRRGGDLIEAYNAAIEGLHRFRNQHVSFAAEYIARQSSNTSSNPTGTGTGGTPFMSYLNDHAARTLDHRI
jgi:indoleamine 2,3-dioxygenase